MNGRAKIRAMTWGSGRKIACLAVGLCWLFTAMGTGCDYESSLGGLECSDDEQCPDRNVCEEGFCVQLPPPDHIDISPDQPWVISEGEELEVSASIIDADGEWIREDEELRWSVAANDDVVRLDGEQGGSVTITGEQVGDAILQIEAFDLVTTVSVRVSDIEATRVAIGEAGDLAESGVADWMIVEGAQVPLAATVYGESGGEEVELEDRVVRWSSDTPSVLKVDSAGEIEARRAGSAPVEITASVGALSEPVTESASFEVVDRGIHRVAVIPNAVELAAEQELTVTAQAYDEQGRRLERRFDEFNWESEDEDTVTVEIDEQEQQVWIQAQPLSSEDPATTQITAQIGGEQGVLDVRVVDVLEDGIQISPQQMDLMESQVATLHSMVIDDGVIRSDRQLQWEIDGDDGIVEFVGDDPTGTQVQIRALGAGSVTMSAGDPNSELDAAEATINVEAAPVLDLSTVPSYVELILGITEEQQLEVELTTATGEKLDEDTLDARGGELSVSAADDELVHIELQELTAIVASTGDFGTTELEFIYTEGEGDDEYHVEETVGVFVALQSVMSVAIEESDLTMEPVESAMVSAEVQYDGDPPSDECQRRWSSDESTVISVQKISTDQAQLISYAEGDATITLECGGRVDTLDVEVTGPSPNEFVVTPDDEPTIIESSRPVSFALEAVFDESTKACPVDPMWSSDAPDIVVVGSDGTVAAVADESGQTATITASCGEQSADAEVEVATGPDSLTIECEELCEVGEEDEDPLEIHPQDGALALVAQYGGQDFQSCNAVWFSDNEDLQIEQDGSMNDENPDGSGTEATITVVCAGVVGTIDIVTDASLGASP